MDSLKPNYSNARIARSFDPEWYDVSVERVGELLLVRTAKSLITAVTVTGMANELCTRGICPNRNVNLDIDDWASLNSTIRTLQDRKYQHLCLSICSLLDDVREGSVTPHDAAQQIVREITL